MVIKAALGVLACLYGTVVLGSGLSFGADPAAAAWQLTTATGRCDLEHAIPDFGTARFSYRAATGLAFELEPTRPVFADAPVIVERTAPHWRPKSSSAPEPMHREAVGSDLLLQGADAEGFLRALYLGDGARWNQGDGAVVVAVSPVNFRPLYALFGDCVAALRPGSFGDFERTSVGFAVGASGLDAVALAQIEAVSRYVASDRRVGRVYVDGHTDSTGGLDANVLLSKQRAEVVAAALSAHAAPPGLIVVRYHGARYPIASNETEEGRAENRRVTIRLERGAPEIAGR